ncbi:hypothetical protein CKC_03710 [Candidatus Liberibacter solanacearum CLso-ZC1]|uniref:Phage related protein n=1 Tax=Liberibacter solanacearum (strain CLso-ZC1) TaxID=658172 RepID=E4UBI5_LIBSC|nr:hypothetical protein CKC_03710 [Candidatus Liberibacter solanacearum CLso-ZC1]
MAKKFELTDETQEHNGVTLHRIKALRDINNVGFNVKKGDLGGWVRSEFNLSHDGDCWIGENATQSANLL